MCIDIPYSGKLLVSIKFGESVIRKHWQISNWRLRALPHRAIVYEIILAGFKFGDFPQNCQFAKLKTSPKFPRYTVYSYVCIVERFVVHHLGQMQEMARMQQMIEELKKKNKELQGQLLLARCRGNAVALTPVKTAKYPHIVFTIELPAEGINCI